MSKHNKGISRALLTAVLAIVLVFAVIFAGYMVSRYKRIPTGKVAVVYSVRGGVKDNYLSEGRHFISPLQEIYTYSISNEQLVLSQDSREGSEGDDSFKVATSDNANISISFQMSYRYYPDKVVENFRNFKGMDGEQIVENRVKTVLKSKVSEVTTNYSLMDIYSGDRAKINNEITEYLDKEFSKSYNMQVIEASIIDVHPDESLKESINARVKQAQEKAKAEEEQKTVKVQMDTEIMKNQKQNQIKLEKAQNEAAIEIEKARAEAEANKMISESITNELIKMKEVEARMEHGWVTIQGADTIVTTPSDDTQQ